MQGITDVYHLTNTPAPPYSTSLLKWLFEKPAKLANKLQNPSLNPKYKAKQFANNSYASRDVLYCKFRQHSVDSVDMCKTTWGLKPRWKTRNSMVLYTLQL